MLGCGGGAAAEILGMEISTEIGNNGNRRVLAAGQKHSASPAMMGLSVSRSRHILQMPCLCLLDAGSQPQPYVLIFYFRCEPPPRPRPLVRARINMS